MKLKLDLGIRNGSNRFYSSRARTGAIAELGNSAESKLIRFNLAQF